MVIRETDAALWPRFLTLATEYLPGSDPARMTEMASRWPHTFLTASDEASGETAGIAFGWLRAGCTEEFCLDGIAVQAPFQRRGIGTGLLRAFERAAAGYGARLVSLGSAEGGAERFYLENGYRPVRFRTSSDGTVRTLREYASVTDYETWPRPCEGFVVMEKALR
ncbi:MAG: GNAT family N-acetyltransferase [Clostridia bacterium]|nr:GNAT family N-acetyltransferase [Clostridia bacterium]